MNKPSQTSDLVKSYRDYLLASKDYAPDTQRHLKRRVFDTFDLLLRHRGRAGLVRGARLLDLGSADGTFIDVCNSAGLHARGLDISDNVNFETDLLPVESGTIDVVTSISVIEHLYSPAMMLKECVRVLRPGGAIILVTPNWYYSARVFFDDPMHVHPYSATSIRWILDEYGFPDSYVAPWVVKKPAWVWDMPGTFFITARLLPFRGDSPSWIPGFLKGRTSSLLALGIKPES